MSSYYMLTIGNAAADTLAIVYGNTSINKEFGIEDYEPAQEPGPEMDSCVGVLMPILEWDGGFCPYLSTKLAHVKPIGEIKEIIRAEQAASEDSLCVEWWRIHN